MEADALHVAAVAGEDSQGVAPVCRPEAGCCVERRGGEIVADRREGRIPDGKGVAFVAGESHRGLDVPEAHGGVLRRGEEELTFAGEGQREDGTVVPDELRVGRPGALNLLISSTGNPEGTGHFAVDFPSDQFGPGASRLPPRLLLPLVAAAARLRDRRFAEVELLGHRVRLAQVPRPHGRVGESRRDQSRVLRHAHRRRSLRIEECVQAYRGEGSLALSTGAQPHSRLEVLQPHLSLPLFLFWQRNRGLLHGLRRN
mmetsp:Transcript_7114/g.13121  ORF Transcript_7114/g.13121 Transcript_7114/m.13121 type:complete len:257 (-) Transcript_7114:1052-1822(-)